MHRQVTISTLIVSITLLLLGLAPAAYAGSCSLASAAGQWGFSYSGSALTQSGSVPIAAAGYYTQDSSGRIAGSEVVNLGGTPADEVIQGQLSLSSNCAWTLVANIYENGQLVRTSVINGVWLSDSTKTKAVFRSVALPDGTNLPVVITIDGIKMFTDQD